MIEQLLGWLGNLCFLFGAVWLARKQVAGFYIQIMANLLYLIQSSLMNNIALFWLSLILMIINIYGVYKWRKK